MRDFSVLEYENIRAEIASTTLKQTTEIYPIWGAMGIDGCVHSTEITNEMRNKLLGKHCVEIVLDYLNAGSPIGFFSTLVNE